MCLRRILRGWAGGAGGGVRGRALEPEQELAQASGQVRLLVGGQGGEELALLGQQVPERPVDPPPTVVGQRDPGSSAVVGNRMAPDHQPALLEPVDPVGHGPAGDQRLAEQLPGGQPVGRRRPGAVRRARRTPRPASSWRAKATSRAGPAGGPAGSRGTARPGGAGRGPGAPGATRRSPGRRRRRARIAHHRLRLTIGPRHVGRPFPATQCSDDDDVEAMALRRGVRLPLPLIPVRSTAGQVPLEHSMGVRVPHRERSERRRPRRRSCNPAKEPFHDGPGSRGQRRHHPRGRRGQADALGHAEGPARDRRAQPPRPRGRCRGRAGRPAIVVVIGHGREAVAEHLARVAPHVRIAVQDEQLGTGHAVQCALEAGR